MKTDSGIILYNVPPSFYSQVARLALAEKGVTWQTRIIAAGPPIFESYQPWYMKLNPGGTVPTMVYDGTVLPDSMLIAEYAERHFGGPRLIPDDAGERAEMQRWIDSYREISLRELSYGSDKVRKIGAFVNGLRIRRLRALGDKHPDMAEIYRSKEQDIAEFAAHAVDQAHMAALRAQVAAKLDALDGVLADRPWIAGQDYSLADIVWTVTVARLKLMGGASPLEGRPALARWYDTVRRRPSFDAADVWERVKPGKLFKMMLSKLWPHLTAILLGLTAIGVGLWLLAGT